MTADIRHATIAHNQIGSDLVLGQAILIQPWPSPNEPRLQPDVSLGHSIIANHTSGHPNAAAVVVQVNIHLTFNQGIFSGNSRETNWGSIPVAPGDIQGLSTMILVPSVGFVSPGLPYYNYHLRAGSSARDRGKGILTADDIDQQNRPYGERSDFGADEYYPFALGVIPGDGVLRLNWGPGVGSFKEAVSSYRLTVYCEQGGSPPQQGACGQPIAVGSATTFTLTGLTNFKRYALEVRAYDAANQLVATSMIISIMPTDKFVFLPGISR